MGVFNSRVAATLAMALAAAACSNDDDPAPVATTPPAATTPAPSAGDGAAVPGSALSSTDALIGYLRGLAADDAGEPLRIDSVPPVDDAGEPLPLA